MSIPISKPTAPTGFDPAKLPRIKTRVKTDTKIYADDGKSSHPKSVLNKDTVHSSLRSMRGSKGELLSYNQALQRQGLEKPTIDHDTYDAHIQRNFRASGFEDRRKLSDFTAVRADNDQILATPRSQALAKSVFGNGLSRTDENFNRGSLAASKQGKTVLHTLMSVPGKHYITSEPSKVNPGAEPVSISIPSKDGTFSLIQHNHSGFINPNRSVARSSDILAHESYHAAADKLVNAKLLNSAEVTRSHKKFVDGHESGAVFTENVHARTTGNPKYFRADYTTPVIATKPAALGDATPLQSANGSNIKRMQSISTRVTHPETDSWQKLNQNMDDAWFGS